MKQGDYVTVFIFG